MRALSLAALAASAAAARQGPRVADTYDALEFVPAGPASADARVDFTAALPTRNRDELAAFVDRVSDPDSPDYGKYMTQEQVLDLIAPTPELRQDVHDYFASRGIKCEDLPWALACAGPVSAVEKMLETKMTAYTHVPKQGRSIVRIAPEDAYTFPEELDGKVEFMTQLADFPTVRMRLGRVVPVDHARHLQASGDLAIVPSTLKDMYKLATVGFFDDAAAAASNIGGPAEFQGDSGFISSDLSMFSQQLATPVGNFTDSGTNQQGGDLEASLDVQYFGAVSSFGAVQNNYYMTAGWMYEFTQYLASLKTAPLVWSLSWGWSDMAQCQIVQNGPCASGNSTAYVTTCDTGFMAAVARGVTLVAASGDSGAHGRTDPSCNDPIVHPIYPGSSPYVLAVGATQLVNSTASVKPGSPFCQQGGAPIAPCAQDGTEIVSSPATGSLIASGGGFSSVSKAPYWQKSAIAAYLAQNSTVAGGVVPPASMFFAGNRGYPDVAALGHNYVVYDGGSATAVDGTSASTPVWAGIISLLNSLRIADGKAPLGLVQPFLYKNPQAFTDITVGNNDCTEQSCGSGSTCTTGFSAARGWDAATGLGTPLFNELLKAAEKLP